LKFETVGLTARPAAGHAHQKYAKTSVNLEVNSALGPNLLQ